MPSPECPRPSCRGLDERPLPALARRWPPARCCGQGCRAGGQGWPTRGESGCPRPHRHLRRPAGTLGAQPPAPPLGAQSAGSWSRPFTGPVTSGRGQRWGRLHAVVDFGAPIATSVHAPVTAQSSQRPGQRLRQLGQDHPPRWGQHRVRAHQPLNRDPRPPVSAGQSSPTAATRAAPPGRTCPSRLASTANRSTPSPSTTHTASC